MPDAEGVNTTATEGSEVGPEENLTEMTDPQVTGKESAPNHGQYDRKS
jgi:hypothetical protein